MYLKGLELSGFKSFAKKTSLSFDSPITVIVGPNGSGKSNIAEAIRWVLGEQSIKSLRGKRGEDLIWNGSKLSPRANRAAVILTFDNKKRLFNLDFEEVAITREVYRDGENHYLLNGSQVRLRDIYELLSEVSLGASSHHIVSQGDADRILNSSLRERRIMIEDALGLRIFQWKKEESQRKMRRTEENLEKAVSLRRELVSHLKFLRKQAGEIKKGEEMRAELKGLYWKYFSFEQSHLFSEGKRLELESDDLKKKISRIDEELKLAQAKVKKADEVILASERSLEFEKKLLQIREKKNELARLIGRLEAQLLPTPKAEFIEELEEGGRRCRFCKQAISPEAAEHLSGSHEREFAKLRGEKTGKETILSNLENEEKEIIADLEARRIELSSEIRVAREAERELFELRTKKQEFVSLLGRASLAKDNLAIQQEDFKREVGEAVVLVGSEMKDFLIRHPMSEEAPGDKETINVYERAEAKRRIERLKIKLEDFGGGGEAVMNEFKQTEERDAFLAREIADLGAGLGKLRGLVRELEEALENKFKEGMQKINKEFENFFLILFGGGRAALEIVKIEKRRPEVGQIEEMIEEIVEEKKEKEEIGIDVKVFLPRKKIRGLEMLSGGERALTSIALLFAMSQVNPPPFLVLDETDAALDEANSRKYGDMIEELAKKSQLILITHNRETMSRTKVLYGVTMGPDSVSKLLSVKFDDASAYAK